VHLIQCRCGSWPSVLMFWLQLSHPWPGQRNCCIPIQLEKHRYQEARSWRIWNEVISTSAVSNLSFISKFLERLVIRCLLTHWQPSAAADVPDRTTQQTQLSSVSTIRSCVPPRTETSVLSSYWPWVSAAFDSCWMSCMTVLGFVDQPMNGLHLTFPIGLYLLRLTSSHL